MSEIIAYDREKTIGAWHRFIETGVIPEGTVRKPVADSWECCRALGVDPFGVSYPHMSRSMLEKVQRRNYELMSYAIPCLRLCLCCAGTGGVSLTSPELFTYYMLSEYERDPLSYGIFLDEKDCGNTAISLAHFEKKPSFLHRYEKFRVVDQRGSSAAVPLTVDGEACGYIALNIDSGLSEAHMLSLISETQKVLSSLVTGKRLESDLLRLLTGLIDLSHRSVLIIDSCGYIAAANRDCRRFISAAHPDGTPSRLAEILVSRDDIGLFDTTRELESSFCDVKTVYGTAINCEIFARERLTFPGMEPMTAVSIGVSTPGRQVRASSRVYAVAGGAEQAEDVEYVGRSMAWSKVDRVIRKVAKFPSNVFLQGESGTGKEVVARTIHKLSGRSGKFVPINCGDIPDGLLQSELFGYEKGSFTGANREGSIGKIEYADHGTLFLDEIGDMPLSMQVSLLRFLQERTIQRIGSNRQKLVDVRIIAATNKDVDRLLKDQLFRNDLYYRLNIIGVTLPPLRERKEDIPVLAAHFARSICEQYGMPVPEIDGEVYGVFSRYDWPGNVRELRNVMEKLLIMSGSAGITADTVYTYVFDYDTFNGTGAGGVVRNTEKEDIIRLLGLYNGNVSKTAAELGMARDTLYRRMKKYGIKFEKWAE